MIGVIREFVIPAAYAVLPAPMASTEATRMLLTIGWQESRFLHRRQINGPARGFFQFEPAGVNGVLEHPHTKREASIALTALRYPERPTPYGCLMAIEHNDVLAVVFARLLLWTHPDALPTSPAVGWQQYVSTWRPGRPHEATWADAWTRAGEALA